MVLELPVSHIIGQSCYFADETMLLCYSPPCTLQCNNPLTKEPVLCACNDKTIIGLLIYIIWHIYIYRCDNVIVAVIVYAIMASDCYISIVSYYYHHVVSCTSSFVYVAIYVKTLLYCERLYFSLATALKDCRF